MGKVSCMEEAGEMKKGQGGGVEGRCVCICLGKGGRYRDRQSKEENERGQDVTEEDQRGMQTINRIVKVYENMIRDKVILMSIYAGCLKKCRKA